MKLFCRHKWQEVDRGFYDKQFIFGGGKSDVTLITYKCAECEKYKQVQLDGLVKEAK